MRFFMNPKDDDNSTTISKKGLEQLLGFRYLDKTTKAVRFVLPPYDLKNSSDIIPLSKLSNEIPFLTNPLEYFEIFYDEKTRWGLRARKKIPNNTVLMMYAGVVINAAQSNITDDYELGVSLPYPSYAQMLRDGIIKYLAFISAKEQGNLSRLFLHLPQQNKLPRELVRRSDIATENVKSISVFDENTQTPMIYFVTTREIEPNEPIGFDYGQAHFRNANIKVAYFTKQCQSFLVDGFSNCSKYATPEQPYGPYSDAYCFPSP